MNIGIIGLGNLGTSLAHLISSNGYEMQGWEHNADAVQEINQQHTNTRYLPGVTLSTDLHATTDLAQVVHGSDVLFITLPSAFIRPTLAAYTNDLDPHVVLVNLAKGIDPATGLSAFQTLGELFPSHRRILVAGPAIANEFARGIPTLVVMAGSSPQELFPISRILDTQHFRVRFSNDPAGVELGGILKNVYAIGLGFFAGKQITSANFRAAYLTLALEEMARLGEALGAQHDTFFYLSGMGDLLATSLSEHSHNRRMGELLAEGHPVEEIKTIMGVLPEGYQTLQTILLLAEKVHVPVPLALGLWNVINGKYTVESFMDAFVRDFI
jgi:glycerol-3-phosphate dehydrogenase (NAD(P)+)